MTGGVICDPNYPYFFWVGISRALAENSILEHRQKKRMECGSCSPQTVGLEMFIGSRSEIGLKGFKIDLGKDSKKSDF